MRRLPARAAAAVVLAATTVASGCAHRGGSAPTRPATTAAPIRVPLVVESHHLANTVIYAVHGSMRQRMGTVTAGATQRFVLPREAARDPAGFYLIADPIGGSGATRTEVLHVVAGQRVVWTLELNLAHSSVAVYNDESPAP